LTTVSVGIASKRAAVLLCAHNAHSQESRRTSTEAPEVTLNSVSQCTRASIDHWSLPPALVCRRGTPVCGGRGSEQISQPQPDCDCEDHRDSNERKHPVRVRHSVFSRRAEYRRCESFWFRRRDENTER
jgi:hypothetical protein